MITLNLAFRIFAPFVHIDSVYQPDESTRGERNTYIPVSIKMCDFWPVDRSILETVQDRAAVTRTLSATHMFSIEPYAYDGLGWSWKIRPTSATAHLSMANNSKIMNLSSRKTVLEQSDIMSALHSLVFNYVGTADVMYSCKLDI